LDPILRHGISGLSDKENRRCLREQLFYEQMKSIRIKKGYDLPIAGAPTVDLAQAKRPDRVASLPKRIPFVKPRLLVKEGASVNIGSVLFEDKRNPDVKFLSPGGGTIEKIHFGKRRVIEQIVIDLHDEEKWEGLADFSDDDLERVQRQDLVNTLLKGGCWALFRALPFNDYPDPGTIPPSIIVTLDSREPFHPRPDIYLDKRMDLLQFGIQVLKKLTHTVHLTVSDGQALTGSLNGLLTHVMTGPYPAGEAGVLLYHIKRQPDENRAWTISGQNLLLLADLLKNGRYPIDRTIVVAGMHAPIRQHLRTRMGVPLGHLLGDGVRKSGGSRFVNGGIFSGYRSQQDDYLGFFETALLILAEGDEKEMFGFARPGFQKPSHSRAFLSALNPSPLSMDCGMHGELRACINCGYCADVCAVDILPQFTLKSILAGEVEEALAHGLLDCVSCGLCTYVCPSKIDICAHLKMAREDYYKEIA